MFTPLLVLFGGVLVAQAGPPLPDPLRASALEVLDSDAGSWLQEAAKANQAGEYRTAAGWLLKVLERHPRDERCLVALAGCYAGLRRADFWLKVMERALEVGLKDPAAALALPTVRFIQDTPEYAQVRSWVARAQEARGDERWAEMTRPLPFRFFCPKGSTSTQPLPLVVALHGRGGTALDLASLWTRFDRPAFRLAVPEAPYPLEGPGQGHRPNFSWDFPSQDKALWARADPQITAYIQAVVAEVRKTHAVQSVFLLGHSQGGVYAYQTVLAHPDAYQGVVAIGSRLPEALLASDLAGGGAGKVAVFVAHGKDDTIIPMARGEASAAAFRKLGYTVTWHPFDGGHTLPTPMLRAVQAWLEQRAAQHPSPAGSR